MSEPIYMEDCAFPSQNWHSDDTCAGMSLRDYFAGQALAGMLAQPGPLLDEDCKPVLKEAHMVASFCYQFADAMLKEGRK